MAKKLTIDAKRCKGCGLCAVACPKGALKNGHDLNSAGYRYVVVDEGLCIGCGACYISCPDYAISLTEGGRSNG